MERALEERRRRANAAWELVRADAIRLGEALGHEASEIRETVRRMAPAAIYRARPLAIAGAATAAAFVVGYRRGRRAAFLARIERASVGEPSPGARGAASGVVGQLVSDTLKAALRAGAGALVASAIAKFRERSEPAEPFSPGTPREPIESARGL